MKGFLKLSYFIWLLMLFNSCKKTNLLCHNDCLGEKLNNYSSISKVWIDGVDYSEEYMSIDSMPKYFFYSSAKTDREKNNILRNDYIYFGRYKAFRRDTVYDKFFYIKDCKLESNENNISFTDLRYQVSNVGTNLTLYWPRPYDLFANPFELKLFKECVFTMNVDYYELTEIKSTHVKIEYDYNGHHVAFRVEKIKNK